MIPHLTLLTVLHRVWGALGVLLGVSTFMLAAGAVAIGVTTGGVEMAAAITAVAFTACAVALLAIGMANLWAGSAMQRRQPNGRTACTGIGRPEPVSAAVRNGAGHLRVLGPAPQRIAGSVWTVTLEL